LILRAYILIHSCIDAYYVHMQQQIYKTKNIISRIDQY